ncbi:MAG: DEAD/DEAH box helicase [Sphingomonadales bacterium]|jgi:ATP-dependent RNA helicase RhlE|nr:DEAD/DEAH box helicase [Sphingomonadales bacterium]MBK9267432.1 DEAD/DEAH box helicase [Sphingomonadales bacterium]MBP6433194.1 DEAD/DEAH box helicase [Sphingorhabdus sp.]
MSYFDDLGLAQPILKALAQSGYDSPTPIQTQAIPPLLEGRDLCGIAQTGTGKTAAFALPSLHHFATNIKPRVPYGCRMLVLSPTRELAAQIAEKFRDYGKYLGLTVQCVFGGMPIFTQKKKLQPGTDILVATPGRLLDLIDQRALSLKDVEIFVLDEADQMMDLGFIHALKRIDLLLPKKRQSLFFSATMPKAIAELGNRFLNNPVRVAVTPAATTAERVEQYVTFVDQREKQALLNHRLKDESIDRALVFTRTKHGADRVVRHLAGAGIKAAAIHGNKSQGQRTAAMQGFRHGHLKVLVATDIAARGIDVPGVSHVFNYELPNVPDQYVHRIGRTARAGADGIAVSFVSDDERGYLKDIEKLTKVRLMQVGLPEGFRQLVAEMPKPVVAKREDQPRRQGGRPGGERPGQGRPAGRKPRPQQRESQLMSRDGYGRDEITVRDDRREDRAPHQDNRPKHKRGGPPISGASHGRDGARDGERPRNYGPKPSGVGKFKGAVKRAR